VAVESNGGPLRLVGSLSGRIHSGELIPAAPAQPTLLAVMVTGFDNSDTVTPRAVGSGRHVLSESVNDPSRLSRVCRSPGTPSESSCAFVMVQRPVVVIAITFGATYAFFRNK
jgi:hypothetical protein